MIYKNQLIFNCILAFGLILQLNACGQQTSEEENQKNSQDEKIANVEESANKVLAPKIENHIVFDVLGGVFSKSNEVESMQTQKGTVAKLSINLPPPDEKKLETTKPFDIDLSYSFLGNKGSGRLTISATGIGEDENVIRHFRPLSLRFLFFKYAYENPCLGTVYLHGEIQCEIEGDYDLAAKNFNGKALCRHGPSNEPRATLYITKEKNYELELDAHLKINGNPFNFESYSYEGEAIIDGARKGINDLIQEGRSCS